MGFMRRSGTEERQLIDTTLVGLASTLLYTGFPQFSDLNTLWLRDHGIFAYPGLPPAFEYPPLAAVLWEPLSWLPSPRLAVFINGLLMTAAAVGVTWVLQRLARSYDSADLNLWVLSPALLMFLPINWDVAAVLAMVVAVVLLENQRAGLAGFALGAGTALKVFPGSLFLPLLPLMRRRHRWKWLFAGGLTVSIAYAAYVVAAPETWRVHLDFASSRVDYETTLWGGLDVALGWFGVSLPLTTINVLSLTATAAALIAVTVWVARRRPTIAEAALLAVGAFIVFNKVFKPQYVLWVLPFAVLAHSKRLSVRVLELSAIVELVAIYSPPLSPVLPVTTVIRLAALSALGWEVVRRWHNGHRPSHAHSA